MASAPSERSWTRPSITYTDRGGETCRAAGVSECVTVFSTSNVKNIVFQSVIIWLHVSVKKTKRQQNKILWYHDHNSASQKPVATLISPGCLCYRKVMMLLGRNDQAAFPRSRNHLFPLWVSGKGEMMCVMRSSCERLLRPFDVVSVGIEELIVSVHSKRWSEAVKLAPGFSNKLRNL